MPNKWQFGSLPLDWHALETTTSDWSSHISCPEGKTPLVKFGALQEWKVLRAGCTRTRRNSAKDFAKVYAHPCIMRTPILKSVFRKKSISKSFLSKNNFLGKFIRNVKSSSTCTKISYRSWCKSFNVLSIQWYIKFYDVFFVFFCCFAAAWSNVIHLHNACNIFMNEESWN